MTCSTIMCIPKECTHTRTHSVRQTVSNVPYTRGIQDVHDREWMILSAPPVDDSPMLDSALEEKNVHVRVRVKDGLPETTHRFRLVQKDGKYQLEEIAVVEEKEEERVDNIAPMMK